MFRVKRFTELERSEPLYTIQKIPEPKMILCVNAEGAARLMNRGRTSVWRFVQGEKLRCFRQSNLALIPLVDIGGMLGLSEAQVYNVAVARGMLIYQYHYYE